MTLELANPLTVVTAFFTTDTVDKADAVDLLKLATGVLTVGNDSTLTVAIGPETTVLISSLGS